MVEWNLGLVSRDHIAGESYPERIRMGLLTRTFTPEPVDFVVDEAGAREEGPRTTTSVSVATGPGSRTPPASSGRSSRATTHRPGARDGPQG